MHVLRQRGIVLITCFFLALLVFGLTVVQVARVTFLSQTAQLRARRLPVELRARSLFNQAFLELRRAPDNPIQRSGALDDGTFRMASRQLSGGVTELEVEVELDGIRASVRGSLTRLEPSPVPFYSVRGPRFGGSSVPTFWYPGESGWAVLPPPTIPAGDRLGGELPAGVDHSNQPFFLSARPPAPATPQPGIPPTFSNQVTVFGSSYGLPPAPSQYHLQRFENQTWKLSDLSMPLPPDGLIVTVSRNQILASRAGEVMAYDVDRGSWRQLVPPGEPLAGNMQVDEQGRLYAVTRTTQEMLAGAPLKVSRWEGNGWVPLMQGNIYDFTPLPDGRVVSQMGSLGDSTGAFVRSDGVTLSLPGSISSNVQKHFLTVDRDGNLMAELVDRGVGGMGNDFRAWRREESDQVPNWTEQESPNQVYDPSGNLVPGSVTSLFAVLEGGNSSTSQELRKVWEFR